MLNTWVFRSLKNSPVSRVKLYLLVFVTLIFMPSINLIAATCIFVESPSIYQPKNAHIISHKTHLKHFKTLRHVSILSDHHQGTCSLLKLYYSIPNSIRICKRGVVAAYHVVWKCVVEQWLGVRRTTHT